MLRLPLASLFIFVPLLLCGDTSTLKPIFLNPGKVFLKDDYNKDMTIVKGDPFYVLGQGTRWSAQNGVLVGIQSTPEYQKKKKATGKGHLGTIPRLQISNTPKDLIFAYSIKLEGGKISALCPMVEFGHHLRRVYFGAEGTKMLVNHEASTLAESDFKIQMDTWYHVMIEIKGNEFLLRIQDGPTFYGNSEYVGMEFANYNIGITGTTKGTVYLDNLTIVEAGSVKRDWAVTKRSL